MARRKTLCVHHWNDQEIQYLLAHYSTQNTREIAMYLNRTPPAVYWKAMTLNIKKDLRITGQEHSRWAQKHYQKEWGFQKGHKINLGRWKGEDSPGWKGGVTPKNKIARESHEWRKWREAIYARDNYTCQKCGAKSGRAEKVYLHPHHILSFAEYLELRFVIDNGITLCKKCHMEFHTKYGYRHNTREQLEEFIS